MKEISDLEKNPIEGVSMGSVDEIDDNLNLPCCIVGPEGSPFEDGIFFINV